MNYDQNIEGVAISRKPHEQHIDRDFLIIKASFFKNDPHTKVSQFWTVS